jgi:hypothetical protein
MKETYLWDRSGEIDPEVQDLERKLSALRWTADREAPAPAARRTAWWGWAAAAAVLIVAAAGLQWGVHPRVETAWETGGRRVFLGETLTTKNNRLRLAADEVGQVEIEPNSVVRIGESSGKRQQLELRQGTLHALIWAPPTLFQVETRSSRAIDLGCQYTLSVDERGKGLLHVETGWVAFQSGKLESFIPAGASCRTQPVRGPGIPFFDDAPQTLRDALAEWESTADYATLERVILVARPRDGLTLWHMLPRVPATSRAAVYDRMAVLAGLPEANREAALRLDGPAMDAAWNALKLEDPGWWREWKRKW